MPPNDLNKLIGSLWKQLSPAQKAAYDDMAKADKARYWTELNAYNVAAPLKIAARYALNHILDTE